MFDSLAQWIVEVVYYSRVAVLMLLSNLFLPVPSELVLPFAGFLVGRGFSSFPVLMLEATAGSLVGALAVYAPAHRLGEEPARRFIKRYGRFVLLSESDLDKASEWFDRHGGRAVLLGRFVPGVRAVISVPPGIERMTLRGFLIYTLVGNGIWNGVFIALGWALGSQWELASTSRFSSMRCWPCWRR